MPPTRAGNAGTQLPPAAVAAGPRVSSAGGNGGCRRGLACLAGRARCAVGPQVRLEEPLGFVRCGDGLCGDVSGGPLGELAQKSDQPAWSKKTYFFVVRESLHVFMNPKPREPLL